jgi:hypothetical protein
MRLTIHLLLVAAAVVMAGCASNKEPEFADVPSLPSAENPVVKPAEALTGRVVSCNSVGGFAVLNFPVTKMPAVGQKLSLYRDGLKVGEVKVTGPQKDDNIVADLAKGEAKAGDEVRER